MGWVDRIRLVWLMPVAGVLVVAPIVPEPHLIEKLHTLPMVLLAIRLWRMK